MSIEYIRDISQVPDVLVVCVVVFGLVFVYQVHSTAQVAESRETLGRLICRWPL